MAQVYEVQEDSDCFVVIAEDRGFGECAVCVCLNETQAIAIAATRTDWRVEACLIAPSQSHNFGN